MIMTEASTLPPATDPDAGSTAAEEADQLGRFLAACCTVRYDAQVPKAALYAAYTAWCAANGEPADSSRTLGQRLLERRSLRRVLKDHKGTGGTRCWRGIALLDPSAAVAGSGPEVSATPVDAPLPIGAADIDEQDIDEQEDGLGAVDDPTRPEYWQAKIDSATGEQEAAVMHLAAARKRAMAATLRHRDMQDLMQAKVLFADDPEVAEGTAEARVAQAALQAARREVLHGERRIEQATAALARAQAQAELARREAWAREHHPELAAALDEARTRLAGANREWEDKAYDTAYGRRLTQGAHERLGRAQAAWAVACAEVPEEEVA